MKSTGAAGLALPGTTRPASAAWRSLRISLGWITVTPTFSQRGALAGNAEHRHRHQQRHAQRVQRHGKAHQPLRGGRATTNIRVAAISMLHAMVHEPAPWSAAGRIHGQQPGAGQQEHRNASGPSKPRSMGRRVLQEGRFCQRRRPCAIIGRAGPGSLDQISTTVSRAGWSAISAAPIACWRVRACSAAGRFCSRG